LPRFSKSRKTPAENNGLLEPLAQQGELGVHYARYLSGRTELLSLRDRCSLRQVRIPFDSIPDGSNVLADLPVNNIELLFVSPGFDTYRGEFEGKPIIVDAYRVILHRGRPWKRFVHFLDGWTHCRSAQVIEQFREWLTLGEDVSRKRDYLANLDELPAEAMMRFPKLIPELQRSHLIAYTHTEGTSFKTLLEREDDRPRVCVRLAELVFELSLFLAVALADPDLNHLVLRANGQFGLVFVPALTPVPLHLHFELLQYSASSLAGDQERSVRMLARLLGDSNHEPLLRDSVKSLPADPHSVAGDIPETVASMLKYHQAAMLSTIPVPIFLTLFHRQLALAADETGRSAPGSDSFSEALWSVLGRIARYRLRSAISVENAGAWKVGGSIASLGLARQISTLLEEVTSDELTILAEARYKAPAPGRMLSKQGIVWRFLLWSLIFLGSLQMAITFESGTIQLILCLVAGTAAILLFQSLSRFGKCV
jgi:hypothetical protein